MAIRRPAVPLPIRVSAIFARPKAQMTFAIQIHSHLSDCPHTLTSMAMAENLPPPPMPEIRKRAER